MVDEAPPFLIQENISVEKYLNMLVYAVHGAGKTYLSGTSSDVDSMRDVLMCSVEGGDMTLLNDVHRFIDIDIIQARAFGQISAIQKFITAHCELRDRRTDESEEKLLEYERWLKGNPSIETPRHYRTILVDSLSEIDVVHRNKLQGIDEDSSLDTDPGDSSWALYNRNLSKMTRLVKLLRDLPIHVIITCAADYRPDQMNRMRFQPKLVGQLKTDVQGIVDVVGYLEAGAVDEETGEQPRRLWVMPGPTHDAKCRWSANKKPYFVNPTMKEILESVGLAA